MYCKTKFDNNNMQTIECEGKAPKSNSGKNFGGRDLGVDYGNKKVKENLIEDTTAGKWVTQSERIGAVIGSTWIGVNISINEPTGRSWISRVAQEGAMVRYSMETQENSYVVENVKDVLIRACEKSGFSLKIVQTNEKRECTLIEGPDKRTEAVLFEDEKTIKIKDF